MQDNILVTSEDLKSIVPKDEDEIILIAHWSILGIRMCTYIVMEMDSVFEEYGLDNLL